jgi:hypothetical protein
MKANRQLLDKESVKSMIEQAIQKDDRIRKLEDIEAVRKLKVAYTHRLDAKDWKGLMELFTRKCSADYGPFGRYEARSELEHFFNVTYPQGVGFTMHRVMNGDIEITSKNKATSRWYLELAFSSEAPEGSRAMWCSGVYIDSYVKKKGVWKIKRIEFVPFYTTGFDTGWVIENQTAIKGT